MSIASYPLCNAFPSFRSVEATVQVYHRLPPNQYRSCRCVSYSVEAFFKICCCHYFFPASSPGLPSPPPPNARGDASCGPLPAGCREARLTAMLKLSRSEPGGAASALAGVWTKAAGKAAGAPAGEWAGVPREGSPQCTRTIKPNAQLPRPLLPTPRIPWKVRRRRQLERARARALSPARVPFSADNYISPSAGPSFIPQQPGGARAGAAGTRARRPEFPDTRRAGGEGGEWGP